MVAQINQHDIKWLAPSPLWNSFGDLAGEDSRQCFNRPAILRFNNDDFMQELNALLSYYPNQLGEWQVKPETWREPMAKPATAARLSVVEPVSQLSKRLTREQVKREQVNGQASSAITLAAGGTESSCLRVQNPDKPLKLYQPAQQRFYLVSASLVCRRSGLPDRFIDSGKQEQPGFVLRRLIPRQSQSQSIKTPDVCDVSNCDEYALVQTATGQQWRNITQHAIYQVKQAVPDEERLPMFSMGFSDADNRRRRLLCGFIPVGKREAYLAMPLFDEALAAAQAEAQAQAQASLHSVDGSTGLSQHKRQALKQLFEMQVAGPWKGLLEQADNEKQKLADAVAFPPPINDNLDGSSNGSSEKNTRKISREQIQTLSWYVLIDLVEFLRLYLQDIYKVFAGNLTRNQLQNNAQKKLYDELLKIQLSDSLILKLVPNVIPSETYHASTEVNKFLKDVVKKIIADPAIATQLEDVDVPYDRKPVAPATIDARWPRFLFPLADPEVSGPLPVVTSLPAGMTDPLEIKLYKVDQLTEWLADALVSIEAEAPEVVSFQQPGLDSNDGWFVIRCIHEQPNCGAFFPAVLSNPTEPFKMASFFDPDAPARPVRIPMPMDISPAGLRKYNKNATFMISDMLCGKIKNMRKISFGDLVLSVLPWPFHKDLPKPGKSGPCRSQGNNFGMFCSLSIPIVTLCAMILLIIMVTLFDLFFRWLPLLFVCFPIPGLKGKKS